MVEQLLGKKFVDCTKKGAEVPASEIAKAKLIGVYFSAHWCPPCKALNLILDIRQIIHPSSDRVL